MIQSLLAHYHGQVWNADEAVQALFLKAQVDRNEVTGEPDPVVKLIDFAHPERNQFHAINQFRIDTPGYVKSCIIPDIVLFMNGIPLVVVEAKIGDPNTANPLHAAFEQLLRYRNGRDETLKAGLREGEPRLFYTNLLLVRSCDERAEFGTITSGHDSSHGSGDGQDIALDTLGSPPPITRKSGMGSVSTRGAGRKKDPSGA
jgi:type I restriction enzyme, R subunit